MLSLSFLKHPFECTCNHVVTRVSDICSTGHKSESCSHAHYWSRMLDQFTKYSSLLGSPALCFPHFSLPNRIKKAKLATNCSSKEMIPGIPGKSDHSPCTVNSSARQMPISCLEEHKKNETCRCVHTWAILCKTLTALCSCVKLT